MSLLLRMLHRMLFMPAISSFFCISFDVLQCCSLMLVPVNVNYDLSSYPNDCMIY